MRSVKINGRAVDPQKIYSGATVDFITGGQAEKYFGFATPNSESTACYCPMRSSIISKNIRKSVRKSRDVFAARMNGANINRFGTCRGVLLITE